MVSTGVKRARRQKPAEKPRFSSALTVIASLRCPDCGGSPVYGASVRLFVRAIVKNSKIKEDFLAKMPTLFFGPAFPLF